MVKNPPANARDMGSIPDWGAREGIPPALGQLGLCTTTPSLCCRGGEPQLPSPNAAAAEARVP